MDKQQVLTKMTDAGLVAVVRASNAEDAIRITDACLEGGCPSIELTFTVPGAAKVIEALASKYTNGEMLLGAGTVLDSETARQAILSVMRTLSDSLHAWMYDNHRNLDGYGSWM